jgi:hypothetical protein
MPHKSSLEIARVLAKILTGHVLNMNVELDCNPTLPAGAVT